jgi:hypothetical protein
MKRLQVMFITPVAHESVQGRGQYMFIKADGTTVNAERSFARTVEKRYNFPRKPDGHYLKTKLSRMIPNPWYDKDVNTINDDLPEHYHVGADWIPKIGDIVKLEQISKQQELEIRFNLVENALTAKCNLDSRPSNRGPNDKANMLEAFTIILYDGPNRFDNTSLRGCLAMELAKVHSRIAESKLRVNPSKHHFYISAENEEVIEKNRRQEIINDAITDLTLLRRQHTQFMRYKIAVILGLVKGSVSADTLKEALNDYIGKVNNRQLDNIKKFNELITLVNLGQEGLDQLHIKYLAKQALDMNIIGSSAGTYTWYSKKDYPNVYNLGSNYNKVLKFFSDEELKYDEDSPEGNWYYELIKELKVKGVQIEEA